MKNIFTLKNIIKIIIAVCIIIVLAFALYETQNYIARNHKYEDSIKDLNAITGTLGDNEVTAEHLKSTYHIANRQVLSDLKEILVDSVPDGYFDRSVDDNSEKLTKLIGKTNIPYIFIIEKDGNVLLSQDSVYNNENLVDIGFFTENQLTHLLKCPDDGVLVTPVDESYYFYATELSLNSKTYYLVTGNKAGAFQEQVDQLNNVNSVIASENIDSSSFIFSVNPKTAEFNYYDHDNLVLSGENIYDYGITNSALNNKSAEILNIDGTDYYCVAKIFNENTVLIEATSTENLYSDSYEPTIWALILVVMALVTTTLYGLFLQKELTKNNKKQKLTHIFRSKLVINVSVFSKIIPLSILALVLIFGAVFYCRTTVRLMWVMGDIDTPIKQIEAKLDLNEESREAILGYCNDIYIDKAQMVAAALELDPSVLNEETTKVYTTYTKDGTKKELKDDEGNPRTSVANSKKLEQMCTKNSFEGLQVYDEQGSVIASSGDNWCFTLSLDPDDQSYEFREVLDGKKDSLVQDAKEDDDGNYSQYVGVAFKYYTTLDENGNTLYVSKIDYQDYLDGKWDGNPITMHESMLQASVDVRGTENALESTETKYVLENCCLVDDGFLVIFDNTDDHTVLYSPHEQNIGKTAEELGVSEAEFSGSYNGFQTVNGTTYFECCRYSNDYYVAICTPTSTMYSTRLQATITTTILCLIALLLLHLLFFITTEKHIRHMCFGSEAEEKFEEEERKEEEKELKEEIQEENKSDTTSGVTHKIREGWYSKSAQEKLRLMLFICFFLVALYFLAGLLFKNSVFGDNAVMQYILTGKWDRGVNIFAFSKSVLVLMAVIAGVNILNWFVGTFTTAFSSQVETFTRLLMSFIKYGAVIAAIFYCLYLFGLDPTTLLASAGILSLVIGLGAQSLISDLLAGIAIVFEGTFKVGDYVSIDGTNGVIVEIGIRTTKIRDANFNIKVVNNSKMSSILNFSSLKESLIRCTLSISYEESVERVESILQKELPLIKARNPQILAGPTYLGVQSLSDSSVDLGIKVICNGRDYLKVANTMNRELLLMCNNYGINIPYPHVTCTFEKDGVNVNVTDTKEQDKN